MKNYNFLIAAGGTGGHLFPAISVVEELSKLSKDFSFHFCGRKDKLEGKIIPSLGYQFHPIEIEGIKSLFSIRNILLPFKIKQSENIVKKLIKKYNIDAVIATGAYISYPPSIAGVKSNVPLFLMESNFNPGKTISILAKNATAIFTSFQETKDFFQNKPVGKLIYTGNPIRNTFENILSKEEACLKLNLDPNKKVVFIFGGSLGSKAINDVVENNLDKFINNDIQIIWQTGDTYSQKSSSDLPKGILQFNFIDDMATCYSASDLVVSRSGASTLSEIALVGKPAIFIPLAIASNNEQEYNARYFEKTGASVVLNQNSISVTLFNTISDLIGNPNKLKEMELCTKRLAKPQAASDIANYIVKYLEGEI